MHKRTIVTATTTAATAAMAALALAAAPVAAWAAPPGKGNDVVNGPDIAAGAQNAPGSAAIKELINAIGFYAIIACLVGLLLSGLILAIGPRLGFHQSSTVGKIGIFASLGVAFLVGISATLINFFYNAGA
ncbi:hypothetical protein GCM10011575_41880 [Microlunatus endophyticus]|uniref:DUF4190 domain-containing protein n=1 Tax=Microlunatus endophyticus TaxID=1716077 RepID=A0A917SHL0_9ACTN|nr:DUF6112 family protein [Microlunatus endophyticus]GGL79131.1 hypothetical protein GCM10011575_41880 [Microlunatus endophyticus]